nr:hypothetical protein GCM10020093_078980 [Planobispora longispora]
MDEEAGPVVRPYALVGGRTRSSGDTLDLVALVVATGDARGDFVPGPEQERILSMVGTATPVADVASELDLPSAWSASSWATCRTTVSSRSDAPRRVSAFSRK